MARAIDLRTDEEREDEQFTRQRLRTNNAPDVHFNGRLLHEYTTQSADQAKTRWTELRLWETRGGAWVAENMACSRRPGEHDLRDVLVIERFGAPIRFQMPDLPEHGASGFDQEMRTILKDEAEAIQDVMAFFGWSVVAKAFAKQAGWDVVRRVD